MPKAEIVRKVAAMPVPKRLTEHGYLLVHGDKPGMLIREVQHDTDFNFYRNAGSGTYGSVDAINALGHKGLKAEIVSRKELLDRARKFGKFMSLHHQSTDGRVKVWLLNSFGDQYVVGVTNSHGKVKVVNIEHPTAHNSENPAVRYDDPKVLKGNFSAFFAQ